MSKIGAVIFLGLAAIFFGVGIFNITTVNAEREDLKTQISVMLDRKEDVEAQTLTVSMPEEVTKEDAVNYLAKAKDQGNKIASLENELAAGVTQERSKEIAHELRVLIADENFVKHRWFFFKKDTGCKWEFSTLNGLISMDMPVMWILKNPEGKAVAWVSGTYEVERDIFSGLSIKATEFAIRDYFDWSMAPPGASVPVDAFNVIDGDIDEYYKESFKADLSGQ